MCGIAGAIAGHGSLPVPGVPGVEAMRDRLAHRGPDEHGLWDGGQVVLGHRRLTVVAPGPQGRQPMFDPAGRGALVYNGELYNDAELRAELASLGWSFRGASDAETLLASLIQWGTAALPRLRGMFAFAFCDRTRARMLLARDPLGIKPLYYWSGVHAGSAQFAFASEIPALLLHPLAPCRPDLGGINAYLTTIRTTLGERTLFEGVRAVQPAQAIDLDLSDPGLQATRLDYFPAAEREALGAIPASQDPAAQTREVVADSLRRHLHADVPVCCLLSGGLDSSILTLLASPLVPDLRTYCSGGRGGHGADDDFTHARLVAEKLGTRHAEVPISRELFAQRWEDMIERQGLPLSTPNEVAINEVARRLRGDGNVVAISGEGADELFAGYDAPLLAAQKYLSTGGSDPAAFAVDDAAWIPPRAKPAVLRDARWAGDADDALIEWYRQQLSAQGLGTDRLAAHQKLLRRINLPGLLQRLDTATMLEGVEGRTPLADIRVAALAESLPLEERFLIDAAGHVRTKDVLRRAFGADLTGEVLARRKASFPIPFQDWIADRAGELLRSRFARDLFGDGAIHAATANARDCWRFAWPMLNVAMWSRRWWG